VLLTKTKGGTQGGTNIALRTIEAATKRQYANWYAERRGITTRFARAKTGLMLFD
jgi:hypothetical protein